MRISVSSWATTESDVQRSLEAMLAIAATEYRAGVLRRESFDSLLTQPQAFHCQNSSEGNLRAGSAHCMAHASARPDSHRHGWLRLGTALGRPDRGDPARRRGLVPAG